MKVEFQKVLPKKEGYAEGELKHYHTLADNTVFKKWDESGETEELDLKVLPLESETITLSARQIEVLEPILTLEP